MVQREFWKNIGRIHKYETIQQQNEMHLKTQQKKLESFVNKQLKLSSKMAGFMQETGPSEKEDSDDEEKSVESEKEEEGNSNRLILNNIIATVTIHITKNENGFVYEKYTEDIISIEAQKDTLKEIA